MKTVAEKIRELSEREAEVKAMGGAPAVAKQHAAGKLSAPGSAWRLRPPGSFQETDLFVTHRCVNFGMEKVEIPADGVITGFGKVEGRVVFAYSQDFTSPGRFPGGDARQEDLQGDGSGPEGRGAPGGIERLGGARIQEGVDSLSGYGPDLL